LDLLRLESERERADLENPAQGGAAVQVTRTHGGEEAFESEGKFVYYAKFAEPGIWRVPVVGGEETRVLDQVTAGTWVLTGQGICFFDLKSPVGPVIKLYDLVTRRQRVIHQFPKQTMIHSYETALSVSPDGQWILYTQDDQRGSDLMLVENFR
jgi:hypothetical protein